VRNSESEGIWVFGDHRNYFQDRMTLQLISRARELAVELNTYVGVVLIGFRLDEYVLEYAAHGADKIFLVEDERLRFYSSELYAAIVADMAREFKPEILLVSGSDFGRELAPRVAARLATGVSADCVALALDEEGNLVQVSPAFDGKALAEIITDKTFPQIATVRPGAFSERPHDYRGEAELIRLSINMENYRDRVTVRSSKRIENCASDLEHAHAVVCIGKGMSKKEQIKRANEFAQLLRAEIGCTRPLVDEGKMEHERLVGQTGKTIRPELLVVLGASGAIQFAAAIRRSKCVLAVNRDPNAAIFRYCDIGVVGDAPSFVARLMKELKGGAP
jgi:electron transfer flavoprotein alpha subunit